jgi:hypothetical protein
MFAALLLLKRLKTRFPAARSSSGHRLFISAFMIASKVFYDETYSNHSWEIVAQRMFGLQEINQMEREICVHLQWNVNIQGDELSDFSAHIRFEHGIVPEVNSCLMPERRLNAPQPSRQVPATYSSRPQQVVQSQISFPFLLGSRSYRLPATPHSSQPPHIASAGSSLISSPASCWRSPSPIIVTPDLCHLTRMTDVFHSFDSKEQG